MSTSTLLAATLLVLLSNVHLAYLQDASVEAHAEAKFGVQNSTFDNNNSTAIKAWEEWKNCHLYLPSFESDVISIPETQKEFVNNMVINDLVLFREILKEAIDKKNTFAPSVQLMWKYTGKLLGNFIRNRQAEQKIVPRKEPSPAFFESVARLAELVLDRSDELKKEMGYSKKSVNTDELYSRVDNVFRYIQRVINRSPVAAYLKWDQLVFFKDEKPTHGRNLELVQEAGDLTAVSII